MMKVEEAISSLDDATVRYNNRRVTAPRLADLFWHLAGYTSFALRSNVVDSSFDGMNLCDCPLMNLQYDRFQKLKWIQKEWTYVSRHLVSTLDI